MEHKYRNTGKLYKKNREEKQPQNLGNTIANQETLSKVTIDKPTYLIPIELRKLRSKYGAHK